MGELDQLLNLVDVKSVVDFGILGLVAFAFLRGWIVPGWLYKQKEEENKQLRESLEEFTVLMKLSLEKLNSLKVRKGVDVDERSEN